MSKKTVYYNPELKELARKLRKNSTLAEVLLWQQLKNKKVCGYDFHRQKPVDNYILEDVIVAIRKWINTPRPPRRTPLSRGEFKKGDDTLKV